MLRKIIILLLLSTSVFAADKLKLLLYTDYPPFTDGTTEAPKGLYPAIVKAAMVRLSDDYSMHIFPWSRALKMAKDGKGVIAGIYKTPEREKILNFSDWFYKEELVLFKRKGDKTDYSAGVPALKGKTVGVNRGWSYGNEFDTAKANKEFKTQEAANDEANLKKLLQKRIDVYPMNSLSAKIILKELKLTEKVEKIPVVINEGPVYLAVSKKFNSKDFYDRFNKVLEEMKKDGSLDDIIEEFEKGL